MADKDLSALLAELGGDNPQNRAIAEGLQKQGIGSTKDIGVKQVPVPGHMEGTDEASYWVPESTTNAYFNKSDGKEINPTRLGVYQVDKNGKAQGDIFFHLNADDKGSVSFQPQWSPRAHGYLRDNAVGQAIMSIGKIIPSPVQPFFVAAGAADALAHGKVMQAVAAAIPYGIQQLAGSTELLSNLSGNADFVSTAKTAAGKIAEAAGAPSYAADLVGKVATAGVTAGINGGDVGAAMLKAGAGSILGQSKDFLKAAEDFSASGIGSLIPEGFSTENFDPKALSELGETLEEVDLTPKGGWDDKGWGTIGEGEFGDEGLAALADENGIGGIDTAAGASGNDTLEAKDGIAGLKPVAYDDEGNLMPGYELDEDNNPTWVGGEPEYSLEGGAGKDYVSPEGQGMVDDAGYNIDDIESGFDNYRIDGGSPLVDETEEVDTTKPLELPPGAEEETPTIVDTGLTEPPENVDDTGLLPKVPPIFPPKPPVKNIVEPVRKVNTPVDDTGLLDPIIKGLVGGTVVGGVIDGLNKDPTPTTPADPLKGNYNFSWNKQQTKGPEKGVAYGQRYYGNQWTQQSPEVQVAKTEQPTKDVDMIPHVQYGAEGGLMTLGGAVQQPTFKPTMTDSGISASNLSKDDVTNQAIQHMRKGGHVIDHKTHKEVSYLASKGEPVHHIVGFMNHRKRMAEGGITSHSLGSYSDGGHLLKGPGDGMSDDIPATIADKQPARLANEEFVIPADVVSHLGNGSSESGAKVLYDMMARIRKARTGNPKQGKQIDPHKLMPKV